MLLYSIFWLLQKNMKTLKLYTLLFCSAFAANNTMTLSNDNHENSFATMKDNFYDEDEDPFAAMGDVFGNAADFNVQSFLEARLTTKPNAEELEVIEEQLRDLNKNFPPKKKKMEDDFYDEDENPFAAMGDVFGCWDEDDIFSEAKFETEPNAEERAVIEEQLRDLNKNSPAKKKESVKRDHDEITVLASSSNDETVQTTENNFYNSVIVAIYQHAINSIKRLCSWYMD